MLSYKQWKMLNESFAGPITLGLAQPTNLGITAPNGLGLPLDEEKAKAMKKSKKKMLGGEDETGDGEMVHAKAPKDDPDVDVDVDGMGDDDMGDDDGGEDDACGGSMCGKNCKKSKKKMMKSKKKMWSDADDDTGDDVGEDDGGDDSFDDDGGDEGEGDDDTPMDATQDKKGAAPVPMMSKKGSKKKMKKEAYLDNEDEWMASVKNMLDPTHSSRKYDDGFTRYYEDALFSPIDVDNLTQAVRQEPSEPAPGDVGFAPQGRVGEIR